MGRITDGAAARLFGAHTIDNGGIHMAARRAGAAGMRALQIFTAIPKYYGDKSSIRPERVSRFRETLTQVGIAPEHVVVHAAYVLNTATTDEEKWARASAGLRKELERSSALGVGAVCFHPGAATGGDRAEGDRPRGSRDHGGARGGERHHPDSGGEHGRRRSHGRAYRGGGGRDSGRRSRRAPGEDRVRTRHLPSFRVGSRHRRSAASLAQVLDQFEEAAGAAPSFFHLNDSEGALGSNKDRHLLLGEGRIGAESFRWLLADPRSAGGAAAILETPQQHYEIAEDDPSPIPTMSG